MCSPNRCPAFWARIANDPTVRPTLGGEGPLAFDDLLDRPDVVALATEHGGFIFTQAFPARWEMHSLFLPQGRGRAVLSAFREAARFMFSATDCVEIITKAADSNRPAQFMACRAGFRMTFRREAAWPDGSGIAYYVFGLDDWIAADDTLPAEGEAFHALLEAAKQASGSVLEVHADDEAHDRAVGAAVSMFKAGRRLKAVWTYNRWATFAGYQQIDLASEEPPIMDVRDALVTVRDDRLEVLSCR